ncbi:MAG TPA: hypothetical protein VN708_23370 [Terriglobales bacterium]|nr:hypothetical protein [Terriglobales bacterium]
MKEAKSIEQPNNYGNHYYAIQDRCDGRLHRDESIHQPQQHTYYHQNFDCLEQRHSCSPFSVRLAHVRRIESFLRRVVFTSKTHGNTRTRNAD